MTKLKFINLFLQILFVRLTKCSELSFGELNYKSVEMLDDNNISIHSSGTSYMYEWYSLQYFVVPFTGWKSNFIFIFGAPKFKRITKKIRS